MGRDTNPGARACARAQLSLRTRTLGEKARQLAQATPITRIKRHIKFIALHCAGQGLIGLQFSVSLSVGRGAGSLEGQKLRPHLRALTTTVFAACALFPAFERTCSASGGHLGPVSVKCKAAASYSGLAGTASWPPCLGPPVAIPTQRHPRTLVATHGKHDNRVMEESAEACVGIRPQGLAHRGLKGPANAVA